MHSKQPKALLFPFKVGKLDSSTPAKVNDLVSTLKSQALGGRGPRSDTIPAVDHSRVY